MDVIFFAVAADGEVGKALVAIEPTSVSRATAEGAALILTSFWLAPPSLA